MVVKFSAGKVIITVFEVVVRLEGEHHVTLQAQNDALTLIGRGANVLAAHDNEVKWSVKLDNGEQLQQISDEAGIAITG